MSSLSILFLFVAIITLALLAINFLLAPRNPYLEKLSAFECGYHSYQQSRSQFHLSFFIYALVYLILDLEIVLLYPYAMSTYENGIFGLIIMLIFTLIITVGFAYELGSGALQIDSRQNTLSVSKTSEPLRGSILISSSIVPTFSSKFMGEVNIRRRLNSQFSTTISRSLSPRRSFSTIRSRIKSSLFIWFGLKKYSFIMILTLIKVTQTRLQILIQNLITNISQQKYSNK